MTHVPPPMHTFLAPSPPTPLQKVLFRRRAPESHIQLDARMCLLIIPENESQAKPESPEQRHDPLVHSELVLPFRDLVVS